MRRDQSQWWKDGYTADWWDSLERGERELFLSQLTKGKREEFFRDWRVWAFDYQIPPETDWDTWLFLAGRGSGKTRSAVEYIIDCVNQEWARRIAIVGQGEDDVRQVMVQGEALALDTPIPTPAGWVAFGDLRPGDEVFARDGSITTVVGLTPIWENRACYAVLAAGAKAIIADERHLWVCSSRAERRPERPRRESIRSTADIAANVRVRRPDLCEFELPMHGALDLPDADLPVPPYTLGAWLGDGDTRGQGTFTCHPKDAEVVEQIRLDGFEVNPRVGNYAWGIKKLKVRLRAAGLLGRKTIPATYLRASARQRLALLQGLMDTDGYVSPSGQASFDNTNLELVARARELMLTLGYMPSPIGIKVDPRGFKTMYRVTFVGGPGTPTPFRLARKVERCKIGLRQGGRLIKKVEQVDSVPVRCIQVAHESGTFLAGEDFVVTHNSGFIECSPSWNKPVFRPSVGGGQVIWPNGCVAYIYSIADTEALRGPQFHLGWCDEPMAAPRAQRERALDNLEFCLRLGEHPQLILTTTPKPDPWLRQMERDAKDPENKIFITRASTYDNARNLAANFLKKIKRKYGGTRLGKQEIDGKILSDEEGALWTEESIDKGRMEDLDPFEVADMCDTVVVSIDPNTKGTVDTAAARQKKVASAAGIIVVGSKGRDRYVIADRSCSGGPTKWGKAAVDAAIEFEADEFHVESNQGGDMCKIVLQQAMDVGDFQLHVHMGFAKKDKAGRAEPVATLYDRGEVHHVGPKANFEELETQMLYVHEGEDPTKEDFDRLDAMVWGMHRLGLKRRRRASSSGRGGGRFTTFKDFNNGGPTHQHPSAGHEGDWGDAEF
jgi:phage terminase large subunit-like protein